MSVRWRPAPRSEFAAAIQYLNARNTGAAKQLRDDIYAAIQRLEERPRLGRPSNFPGCRAWSLVKWRKIIVYRVEDDGLEIVRLLDAGMQPPDDL
ncbi:MAG: type II toxin-antitoxin system RelE/ParE family toxin [Pseudomonadota bacterium]